MESGSIHDEVTNTSPLLPRSRPQSGGGEERSSPDSATAVLVLSTFVAVSGSYVFGCAVGYSSPAQSGILDDLGLTLAEVPVYIAEITPKNLRGVFTAVNQLMICFGASVMYLVGNLITWRILALIGFSYRVGTTAMVIVQVSVGGTCLGCFLIGLSYLLQDLKLWDSSPSLALVGVLVFTGSFSLGMGGIPWVIMSEVKNIAPFSLNALLEAQYLHFISSLFQIFPINVKGLAGSLVTVVNWFGSWIITYSFNFLAQWSSAARMTTYAGPIITLVSTIRVQV
ncbi:UNVERIFIED_CONTAM: Sugar transporter ERD6-like 5 [Sesamum radiatum]|uniref:Sugar transporter ERD6-like 5 n=1 Tax=Sesamum radiatum TaxID=300843 RepID=A0AAW2V7D3_SESRA